VSSINRMYHRIEFEHVYIEDRLVILCCAIDIAIGKWDSIATCVSISLLIKCRHLSIHGSEVLWWQVLQVNGRDLVYGFECNMCCIYYFFMVAVRDLCIVSLLISH
jgi:hypothetical protein